MKHKTPEANMEVRLYTQAIQMRRNFKYFGSIIQSRVEIEDDVS